MKITSSKEVYNCSLFRVAEEEAVDKTGWKIKRAIVRHRGSAVMMAVDARGRIMLVRQYRLPADEELWELPAGKIDKGEKPLQTAKRELMEETGLKAKKWKKLVSFYPSPGYVGELMTVYLATGLTQGKAAPMEDERIQTRWFRKKDLRTALRSNKIVDGKTMIGFLYWDRLS
jgi:ADP-ribose pyrophosphatase